MTTPTTAGGAVLPAGVDEALQRLIENAATMGPASRDDAILVAKHRAAMALHAPAQAAIDALSAEVAALKEAAQEQALQYLSDNGQWIEETGRLRAELAAPRAAQDDQARAVVAAGALMANTMFNLSQHPGRVLTDAECVTFKQMQVKWDAATAATKETP